MQMAVLSTIGSDISKYLNLTYIPEQYRWLVPIALLIFSIALLFFTGPVWKYTIALLGAIGGYFAMAAYGDPYIASFFAIHSIPLYFANLIVACIVAVVLSILIRLSISLAAGYAGYLAYTHLYPATNLRLMATAIVIAAVVTTFIYFLYNKLIQLLGRIVGTLGLFFSLILFSVPVQYAVAISIIVLLFSLFLLMGGRKKIAKMIQSYKTRKATRPPKVMKTKTSKETKVKEVTHRMSNIVHNIGSHVKKIVSPLKKSVKEVRGEAQAVEKAVEKIAEKVPETITTVNEDGTITQVKK